MTGAFQSPIYDDNPTRETPREITPPIKTKNMTIRTPLLACALASLLAVEAKASAHSHLFKDPTLYLYDIDDSYNTNYSIDWVENVLETQTPSPVWSGTHANGGSDYFWWHYNSRHDAGYSAMY